MQLEKNLNIVTLNVPYPADYGGMIDTFYRIRHLSEAGVKIHLHCFTYGRAGSKELESICESVHYYPRRMWIIRHLSPLPFIVSSRRSDELRKNLSANSFPIFFDGHHTAFLLDHPGFRSRRKFVRLHNIEHNYYASRSKHETNPFRKLYFSVESHKLRRFEKILSLADAVFPVTNADQKHFEKINSNAVSIPPFHPFDDVQSKTGSGNYILYHGDLSINENREIAEMLIRDVFSKLEFKCILAGKKPPLRIRKLVLPHRNITLIADPPDNQMRELVKNAHINLIPAAEPDGFKIKLLFALMSGRHCIVNRAMTAGPALSEGLIIADTPEEMVRKARILLNLPFSEEMLNLRRKICASNFANRSNVEKLLEIIFPEQD